MFPNGDVDWPGSYAATDIEGNRKRETENVSNFEDETIAIMLRIVVGCRYKQTKSKRKEGKETQTKNKRKAIDIFTNRQREYR